MPIPWSIFHPIASQTAMLPAMRGAAGSQAPGTIAKRRRYTVRNSAETNQVNHNSECLRTWSDMKHSRENRSSG
jgi:hypothetical protein